ncbi:oligosaccharide flippase family protein [Pseudosulfitobacter pseudonitzschiae]|uniref:oligosaccharide flippase family protein n=2 Tax=Pseudosulfitobacter pseudonitzschiae TaxID=1402135 RepID=UPI001BB8047C|nr:oligosaccharide flippase family protein [Pseudosulfitobacter pseudonitzschiae]MBM1849109.1 oligosaccharide flippase family protein [Pseudosulfitobacter pseudonitzschiae]MBM1907311.1 oligosaccharide flippase family protein [Pseudosulfitobacter pseudonitzschiae]MBM1931656.1 oligosaccharide flippase family protein [Pseudosulfitobacter pseudonitzschiae]MBM1999226.1 oligosaccharide flippase family protein [Pseudosulfitobacter pseudonitzschiae]MBM2192668.1 oligosaccharide flippase family protein 
MTNGHVKAAKRDHANTFLRRGVIIMAIRLYGVGMTFLVTILLTRGLGADGYGAYAFLFAVVTLAALPTQFGLPDLVVRETTRAAEAGAPGHMRALWRWAHRFIAVTTLVVIALLLLWQHLSGDDDVQTSIAAYIAFLLIPLIALANLRAAILRGLGHDLLGQLPEHAIRPTLFALFLLAMLLLPDLPSSVTGAFAVQVTAVGLATAIGSFMLWRLAPRAVPIEIERTEKRRWNSAAFFMGTISGLVLINNSVDIIMLGLWKSNADVGHYRLASMVGALITLGMQTMNIYAMPHLTHFLATGEKDKLARVVRHATQLSFGFSLLALVAILLLGEQMLVMVFGSEFSAAFSILLVLASGHVLNAFFGPARVFLMMAGHERLAAFLTGFGTLFNIGLNALLIPSYGPIGAAMATVASIVVTKVMSFVVVWHLHGVLIWPLPNYQRLAK